jgi:hypothetical protein
MKIGHKDLASARRDVRSWVAARLVPGGRGPRSSYAAMTREGVFRYHATGDLAEARAEVRRRLDNQKRFKSLSRKDEAEYELVEYAAWYEREGTIVADWRITINFPLANRVALGGQISRVDVIPATGQYRAVLLGRLPDDWPDGIRFPLLQRAVAQMYQRDESDVHIGEQELTRENLRSKSFSSRRLAAAERVAKKVAEDVNRVIGELRGS